MAERYLTFAEVQQLLGLSTDEVRELMESKTLKGVILDGVIKFHESEVTRLRGTSSGPAGRKTRHDMGLVFLVDEEEEKRIEGKAYDGEELLKQEEAEPLAPDEEIMEPVELSEEQLRNSALLGTEGVVEFGREVAERARKGEFESAELSEGEEIIDASKVELPEPDFGKLATAVPEARREEPPRPEPSPAPEEVEKLAEPEAERPEEGIARPTLKPPEKAPVEPVPVEEEVPATLEEDVVGAAAVESAESGETPAEEAEDETVEFRVEGEPEPITLQSPEKELTFLEEETGPMVCPVSPVPEGAPAEEAPAAPPVTEQIVPQEAAPTLEEEETPSALGPVEEAAEEAVRAETPAETKPEEPLPEEPGLGMPRREVLAEEVYETFEVAHPAPTVPVTESFERAVDEEVVDLEAEPEGVEIEELVSKEETPPAEKPDVCDVPEVVSEELEAPAAELEVASGEPAPPVEEKVSEEAGPTELPVPEETVPAETVEPEARVVEEVPSGGEPAEVEVTPGEAPAPTVEEPELSTPSGEAAAPPEEEAVEEEVPAGEEVEQVTEEKKKEEERAKPSEEELVPPAEEAKKAEEEAAPESIEVFDLETAPAAKGGEGEGELVTLEEEAPAKETPGEAAAKEKTLEEEMAELFGEEKPERPPEEAFAAQAPTEDFDLSVFQKDTGAEQAMPVAEESLFEVGEQETPVVEEVPVEEVAPDVETVSRIRALTEERRAPSTVAFTAAALLAFVVLAFTGMLLWHIFITK
jgi:hypothetical protein